jgi:hypothetical protein
VRFVFLSLVLVACSAKDYSAAPDSTNDAGGTDGSGMVGTDAAADNDVGREAGAAPCLGAPDCERFVFVTSAATDGNLGGLQGADDTCQMLADKSTRVKGRQFRAWLSTDSTPAKARVPHGKRAYKRTDGEIVANDFDSIISSAGVLVPINVDENGIVAPESEVWTGTDETGQPYSSNCQAWVSNAGTDSGRIGSSANTDQTWTQSTVDISCSQPARVYCFEN